MSYTVSQLAHDFGVEIVARSCVGGHVYDGHTIAHYGCRGRLSEHDLLHEVGHWVAAAPWQRHLPEYGLFWLGVHGSKGWGNPQVLYPEMEIQECMAQYLSVYWGQKYGFSPILTVDDGYIDSWDHYLQLKTQPRDPANGEHMWEAMLRLRQQALIL